MAGLAEAFSVIAVFEAVDKMSTALERMDAGLDKFSSTAVKAAETATEAGAKIDESLLQTASGADAVELADAKLAGARDKLTAATARQAEAEKALLDAQREAAVAADGDAAASEKLVAASDALTAAQKKTVLASKEASAAASAQADVVRATAAASDQAVVATDATAASTVRAGASAERAAAGGAAMSKAMKFGALGIAAVGYESIKAAGNFESMTEHLVTDAGESQQNIGLIRSGMLALATTTGTTTEQMAAGMYHVESAGFHGQKALDVLKVAAEGAKVGGADLDTIGQALTGTMNAFGAAGGTSTQMMNAMIATVGAGDMKMEAFGSSLGNVAAIGASAKLSFAQVGGAVATMTAQNVSAQRATQDLAHTIGSLGNPTAVMTKEMTAMGLDSLKVSSNLGKNGLTGTFDTLVQAIAAHTKGGQVEVDTLNASKAAAAQANAVLGQMPPAMKKVSESWTAGTTTTAQYNKAVQALPPAQQKMYLAFEQMTKKSGAFAQSLQANTPMAQTFNAALAKMTGGTTSLNTILMLSGQHAATFKDNVATISSAAHKSGSEVDNWSAIQGTFNQKLDVLKASTEAAGISIGTALLPVVTKVAEAIIKVVVPIAQWISKHQTLVLILVSSVVAFAAMAKAVALVSTAVELLGLAIDGTPIGMLVVSIGLLVAGFLYLWGHVKGFRDFWISTWNVIKEVFGVVKTIVMTYIDLIVLEFKFLVAAAMQVWQGLQAAWGAVSSGVVALWHDIGAAWNAIVDVTTTVWNAISAFFMKWWPLLLVIFAPPIAALLAIWNHFHTEIIGTAKTVWNAVASFFVMIWHGLEGAASAVWTAIKVAVIQPMQATWSAIQPIIHAIESFLSAVWNGIRATASAVWNGIQAAIINPITGAWHTVTSVVGSIASAISGGLQSAWNAVSNIGSQFLSIGSDIINGIIQGVENMGSALFGSVENIAKGALNAAKSFLGIGSPSKLFRDEVGQWIPHGIAAGVDQYAAVAHAAVARLSSSLTGTAHTAVTASFAVAGGVGGVGALAGASIPYSPNAGGGAGGTAAITIDLRGAVIANQQAMRQLSDQVGKSITAELARAGVHIRA